MQRRLVIGVWVALTVLVGATVDVSAGRVTPGPTAGAAVQPAATWGTTPIATLNEFNNGGGLAVTGSQSATLVFQSDNRLYAARTANGGSSWSGASQIGSGTFIWSVGMASLGQAIDVAYSFQGSSGDQVRYRHSLDGGASWAAAKTLGFGDTMFYVQVARGANGLVAVVGWAVDKLKVRVSTNGGASFGATKTLTTYQAPCCVYDTGVPAVAISGHAVIVSYWHSMSNLQVRRSTNGGASWSTPKVLSTATGANQNALAAHGTDVLAFYPTASTSRARISHDGGVTWLPAVSEAVGTGPLVLGYSGAKWRLAYGNWQWVRYRESSNGLNWSSAETVTAHSNYGYGPLSVGVLAGHPTIALTSIGSGASDPEIMNIATRH